MSQPSESQFSRSGGEEPDSFRVDCDELLNTPINGLIVLHTDAGNDALYALVAMIYISFYLGVGLTWRGHWRLNWLKIYYFLQLNHRRVKLNIILEKEI